MKRFMKLKQCIKPLVGKGRIGREQVLIGLLEKLRINYIIHPYHYEHEEHRNYIFSLGKKEPGILLCAHYDTFPDCPGANDDASGIAVLFGLYQALRKKEVVQKVTFAFFDQEEIGCVGSRAFAEKNSFFSVVVSLDLVGYGEVVGLWPITPATKKQAFYQTLLATLKKREILCETAGELPVFYADFSPFREKGIKDSFCMTMLPKKEVYFIRKVIKRPYLLQLKLATKTGLPSFFEHYHTEKDNLSIINEKTLQMVVTILEEGIMSITL